jgi:hypothetical protein
VISLIIAKIPKEKILQISDPTPPSLKSKKVWRENPQRKSSQNSVPGVWQTKRQKGMPGKRLKSEVK